MTLTTGIGKNLTLPYVMAIFRSQSLKDILEKSSYSTLQ